MSWYTEQVQKLVLVKARLDANQRRWEMLGYNGSTIDNLRDGEVLPASVGAVEGSVAAQEMMA